MKYCILLVALIGNLTTYSQNATKAADINWELYDPGSAIAKVDITTLDIQGIWKAYKGAFKFGDVVNGMNLTKPFIVEIKDDSLRRNSNDSFQKFTLQENYLIIETKETVDTGIVNKLTKKDLTISWKKGSNYTRYYYRK